MNPSYQDLTEVVPVRSAGGMGAELHKWARDGVLVLPKVLPDELIDRYCALREKVGPGGWGYEVPYMHYRELRDPTADRSNTCRARTVGPCCAGSASSIG